MTLDVESYSDAGDALAAAREFLEVDPVRNNVILSLLEVRASEPREGRYVLAREAGQVCGVLFQSPLTYIATITPMSPEAVEAIVDHVSERPPVLPGVVGEAATAARFAGHWTERTKCAAVPEQGQRLYEVTEVDPPVGVEGRLRAAETTDEPLLIDWLQGFNRDTAMPLPAVDHPATTVRRRVAAGQFWVWDDGEPRSMAALTQPTAGVARIQAVYTPPELRGHGYASANVAGVSEHVLAQGNRCILYTDLGYPVSNSVYRRLGYRAQSPKFSGTDSARPLQPEQAIDFTRDARIPLGSLPLTRPRATETTPRHVALR